jgi:L-serine deaminase
MGDIVTVLKDSIQSGLAGTEYADRVLGYQSGGFQTALAEGRLLDAGALNIGIAYVTALMEVKSSMGVIVAMPTAGACAALPGIVIAVAEARGLSECDIADAFIEALLCTCANCQCGTSPGSITCRPMQAMAVASRICVMLMTFSICNVCSCSCSGVCM